MEIASLCRLPVGVVAWEATEPMLTVVVKATFSLREDGEAALASEQLPLVVDHASALDRDELDAASDFAPRKARAEVLLLGNAHAAAPSTALPAAFRVDDLERRFFAITTKPSAYAPLAGAYLRRGPSSRDPLVRVGPQAPWGRARAGLAGGARVLPGGGLDGPIAHGFDFRFFNAAPAEQQLDVLRSDARIVLEGLLAGTPRRGVRLPAIRPIVFALVGGQARMIALRCDTLTIDAARARCALSYRGEIARREIEAGRLVVAIEGLHEATSWAQIQGDLDRAVVGRAVEPSDLLEREAPASAVAPSSGAAPDTHAKADAPATSKRAPAMLGQVGRSFVLGATRAPAPVEQAPSGSITAAREANEVAAPISAPPEKDDAWAATTFVGTAPEPAMTLPFASSDAPAAPRRESTVEDLVRIGRARKFPRALMGTISNASRPVKPELPFAPSASPPSDRPAASAPRHDGLPFASPEAIQQPAPPSYVPPSVPPPAMAAPEPAPPSSLPLPPASLAPVVAAVAAPDDLEGPLPFREYVAIRVALEQAPDPTTPLAARGIAAAEWRRLHRSVTRRVLADSDFEGRLRAALSEERRKVDALAG